MTRTCLADDAEGEDQLSGWSTDADADEPAALTAGAFGPSGPLTGKEQLAHAVLVRSGARGGAGA